MMNTKNTGRNEVIATARRDLADAMYMFALAGASYDLALERRAVAKYKDLVDTLYTFGISIAEVA